MTLKLVIGNKNYSSWSMRPWMAMKIAGVAFEERLIPLDDAAFKSELCKLTPAGKVPVLIDGDRHIGNRSRSSNMSRKNSLARNCGPRTPSRAPMPA